MEIKYYGTLLLIFTAMSTIQATPQEEHVAASQVILLTIERSIEPSQAPAETMLYKIESPSRLNRMLLKAHLRRQTVEGIYATYRGWYTVSDYLGRITFPRKTPQSSLTLIITRGLQPILLDENLVHHFIMDETEAAEVYKFIYDDSKKNKPVWHVSKQPIPQDRTVPIDALVLLTKPEHIYIPTGTFDAIKSQSLILPTIYARGQLTPNINALHFADINRFFSPTEYAWRFGKARYAFMVAE
jgi:hypothetical protein